jgi:hypothetical protein
MLPHYQQDNLRHLSKEIFKLQENLSKFDRSQDGQAPQGVDVVHLLAACGQELRAVTAERDQLLAQEVSSENVRPLSSTCRISIVRFIPEPLLCNIHSLMFGSWSVVQA